MLSHQHVACYTPSLCGSCLPSTASTSSSAANRWCSTQGTVHPQDRHGGHHMQQSCVHLPGGLPLFVPVRSVPSSTTQRSHASAEHRQRAVDVLELGKVFRLLVAVRWAGGGEQLCEDGRAATTDGAHDTRTCSIAAHVQSRPSQPRTCHSAVVDRTVRPEWAMRSTCPTSAVDREGGGVLTFWMPRHSGRTFGTACCDARCTRSATVTTGGSWRWHRPCGCGVLVA